MVVADLALAGEKAEPAQRLLTPAAASLTVLPAAMFGPFSLHVQQLRLQLPEMGITVITPLYSCYRKTAHTRIS